MTQPLGNRVYVYFRGGSDQNFEFLISRLLPILTASFVFIAALYYLPIHTMASETQEFLQVDLVAISSAISKFSASLFKVIGSSTDISENVFLSPFSVAAVLSMAHVGARGRTATEIRKAMHVSDYSDEKIHGAIGNLLLSVKGDENFTLEAANQLYVAEKYALTQHFQSAMKQHFGAVPENVNFAVDQTRININIWVEEFTHNKIKDLIPGGALDALTKLVLVNAIYFKGNWLRKFDVEQTKVQPFYLGSEDNKVDAHMMHIDAQFRSGFLEALDARVLELPYVGRKLSMFIVLPNQINGLAALESKMSESFLEDIDQGLRNAKIQVAIPKFKIEADLKIKQTLIQMGMADLFDDCKADLSGISGGKDLFVSEVFHKAFVEVNEEGSEAAAATAGVMRLKRSLDLDDLHEEPFVANHPCLWLLRDNTSGLWLFLGRIARPSISNESSTSARRDEL